MNNNLPCSVNSSNVNEQLFGTAPSVEHWFIVECSGNWAYDALESGTIPKMVTEYITNEIKNIENSRIQIIQRDRDNDKGPRFYYANSTELEPSLYEFPIEQYVDILDIDLISVSRGNDIAKYRSDKKLVLVCTHGTHDKCCGTYGVPVYKKLLKYNEFEVWRTSHVGGHRFSANVIMLPEGMYYGRVNVSNLKEIMEKHRQNKIFLSCYRGRSCYSQPSQVSDYFLRDRTGELGIYDIRLEFEKDREYNISVEFSFRDRDIGYSVNSVVLYDSIHIPASCGDEQKKSIPQFYFYSLYPYTPSKVKKTKDN